MSDTVESAETGEVNFESDEFFESVAKELFSETQDAGEKKPEQEVEAASEHPNETGGQETPGEEVQATDSGEEAKPEPTDTPQISPQLAAIARKEREFKAQREAWERTKQEELTAARTSVVQELMRDPLGFIERYKIEKPADLGMQFYAAELGDDAPPELKKYTAKSEFERQKAEMQALLEDFKQQQAQAKAEQARQAYVAELDGFLQGGITEDFPYLAAEVQGNRSEALDAMCQVASQLLEGATTVPTARQVAEVLEREIEKIAVKYSSVKKPTTSTVATSPTNSQHTINNEFTGRASPSDPKTDEDYIKDATQYMLEHMPNRR